MQAIQWLLLFVSVQQFHPLLSLSSDDEISESECVSKTVKFNTSTAEFLAAFFGHGQCPCNISCPNIFEYVEFYIYDPNTNNFHLLFLNGSNANLIDPNKSTTIFVHGFVDNFQPDQDVYWMNILCRMESQIFNRNTIAINYGRISRCTYIALFNFHAQKIGDTIHRMLNDVLGIDLRQVNCVGHSLGSHICGWASGGQFKQCFGLDPAMVKFGPDRGGLRAISCQYVQAIHTDPLHLGTLTSRGHIDFFVFANAACKSQPNGCSHFASVEYYKSSLDPNNEFLGQFCKQSQSNSHNNMNCRFGPHNKDNCTGVACFDTSPCAPFVVPHL